MEIEGKKRIYKCYDELVNNITGFELTLKLIESKLLTFEDGEEIRSGVNQTESSKVRLMLDKLLKKTSFEDGSSPYLIFINCLRETKRNDLADLLQNADISTIAEADLFKEYTIQDKMNKFILNIQSPIIIYRYTTRRYDQGDLSKNYNDNSNPKISMIIDDKQVQISNKDFVNYIKQMWDPKDIPEIHNSLNINLRPDDLSPSGEDVTDEGMKLNLNNMNFIYSDSIQAIACEIGEYLLMTEDGHVHSDKLFQYMKLNVLKVINKHDKELNKCMDKLHITELQAGYPAVGKIADELFIDKNWGRIITWYAFWKHLVINLQNNAGSEGNKEIVHRRLGNYVGFVLADRCGKWINHKGGWTTYAQQFEKPSCLFI